MLPLLQLTKDGKEYSISQLVGRLADQFHLSEQEKSEMLPSGKEAVFSNRTRWARYYLLKAGFLTDPHRGIVRVTDQGLALLKKNPTKISWKDLFTSAENSTQKTPVETGDHKPLGDSANTPEELIETGYQKLRQEVEAELLAKVKKCSPKFFENLVVELMVKLGYGGSFKGSGFVTGKSGDKGIDGVIREDKLGFDFICIQAKRWDTGAISREDVQKFVGALHGQKANKGIFITTSVFAKTAVEYANTIQNKVVLIDGQKLAELMFETGLGLSLVTAYEVKKIDVDYFFEDEESEATAAKA